MVSPRSESIRSSLSYGAALGLHGGGDYTNVYIELNAQNCAPGEKHHFHCMIVTKYKVKKKKSKNKEIIITKVRMVIISGRVWKYESMEPRGVPKTLRKLCFLTWVLGILKIFDLQSSFDIHGGLVLGTLPCSNTKI